MTLLRTAILLMLSSVSAQAQEEKKTAVDVVQAELSICVVYYTFVRGCAIEKADADGVTPLLMAVENGHFQLAIHLVKLGADPNDQHGGYTALHNVVWVRKPTYGEGDDGTPVTTIPESRATPDDPGLGDTAEML